MNNQCPSLGLNTETMPRPVCLKSAIFFRIDAIFFRIDASFLRNSYTNCCYRLNQAKPSSRVQDCSSYLVVKIYFDASYSTAVSHQCCVSCFFALFQRVFLLLPSISTNCCSLSPCLLTYLLSVYFLQLQPALYIYMLHRH